MKKKSALALSTIVLLGAGLTFGGGKLKQKKEFEKTLKTVLIPNAEKELDDLLRQDAALCDSVIQYERALKLVNIEMDYTNKNTNSKKLTAGPFREIYDLIKQLQESRDKELFKINRDKLGNKKYNEPGDWEEKFYKPAKNKTTEQLHKRIFYLTGNKDLNRPFVPIKNYDFVLKHPIQIPLIYNGKPARSVTKLFTNDKDIYTDVKSTSVESLDDFFTTIMDAIISTSRTTTKSDETNNVVPVYKNTHPGLKFAILKSLESFIDAVDNSHHAFDTKALTTLNTLVQTLMPNIELQYELENDHDAFIAKSKKFKSGKKALEKHIKHQKEKIEHMKTAGTAKLMREQ